MTACDDAQDSYLEAKIAEATAQERYDAAREQTARDKPSVGWDMIGLIACGIGSGLLDATVIGAPIGTALIVTCGGVALHDAWSKHERYNEDVDRQDAALKALKEARKRAAEAQAARSKACHKPHHCGERGGPGYRRPGGKCAAWSDGGEHAAYA